MLPLILESPQYKNQYSISEGEGVTQNTSAPQFMEVFELAKTGIQFLCECSATLMELVSLIEFVFRVLHLYVILYLFIFLFLVVK